MIKWYQGGVRLICTKERPNEAALARDRNVDCRDRVRLFAGLSDIGPAAAALYEELLAPAIGDQAVRRLIIVPDGPLYGLPFGALKSSVDAPALGLTTELVQAPSLSMWSRWSQVFPAEEGAVVAFADPEFSTEAIGARLVTTPPRLPGAAKEASALASLNAEVRGGADLMLPLYLLNISNLSHHSLVPSHSLDFSVLVGVSGASKPLPSTLMTK